MKVKHVYESQNYILGLDIDNTSVGWGILKTKTFVICGILFLKYPQFGA
jgi:CRISPR/Cas system Type II protein with McrA/HNH and RuvC-like nuclease domain